MFDIGKYLDKFRLMHSSQEALRNCVVDTVQKICGIDLNPKTIEIKKGVIKIHEKPVIKTLIFIKKNKILDSLNEKINVTIKEII